MFNCLYFKNMVTCTCVIKQLQFLKQTLVQNAKYKQPVFYRPYHCSPNRAFRIKSTKNCVRQETDPLSVNTNVQNNVLLYKHENNGYLQGVRIFLIGGIFCSATIAYYSYSPKIISEWSKTKSWKEYLRSIELNSIFFFYGLLSGPLICLVLHFSIQRFIKYIILHKGGKDVTIVTSHLFKNQIYFTVPVEQVQASCAQKEAKSYLPLKIQHRNFYYLIDNEGTFLNESLFNSTICTSKYWKI
ncbi:transmembrane protein 223 [Calliopsis andreniformis]|uniref:transmembrane protein 223 n=1 Tax=Calliopsis andreniformis TaxID=337506 RepID=UPI003FCD5F39